MINETTRDKIQSLIAGYGEILSDDDLDEIIQIVKLQQCEPFPQITKEQWADMDRQYAKLCADENPPKPMPDSESVAETVRIMGDEFKKPSIPWQKQDVDTFHKIVSENNRALGLLQDSVKSVKIPKPDYYWLAIVSLVANCALVIFILSNMVSQ